MSENSSSTGRQLAEYGLTDRVEQLRDAYFRAVPEICVERPLLLTRYHRYKGLFSKDRITILDKARAYRDALSRRTPVVWANRAYERDGKPIDICPLSLFAGSTTSKFKGVPLYPEFLALNLWPELHTLSDRPNNPYRITADEVKILSEEVFPYWMDHTIMEVARARYGGKEDQGRALDLLQDLVFFLASKPNCISHTVPCFSEVLSKGLAGLIEEARQKDSTEFYRAIAEAMEGIVTYSRNLADKAEALARNEQDAIRRKELKELARIHRRVPERPAETFREALTAVWICWTAIHFENPNVGLSLGRLDQVLYPFYEKDRDSGKLSVAAGIELICLLWLKIGDHVPTVPEAGERLFGGTGSNQAITIGGIDATGNDAVNELTYVMLRATELMRLRDPNLNARYHHRANSDEYLRRICEVNVTTGATPAIHNDVAAIAALKAKGDGEYAWDYASVGCVEPCSNGRHYGHSAAIMLNLLSTLELAMFNGKHRHTRDVQIGPRTGDASKFSVFEDFREAFREQVEWIVKTTVDFNNCLWKVHQAIYPTPTPTAHPNEGT